MRKALGMLGLMASAALAAQGVAAAPAWPEGMEAQAWIDPRRDAYPADEAIRYTVEVRWAAGAAGPNIRLAETPAWTNLVCKGFSASKVADRRTGQAAARFQFTLWPVGEGKARIGATYLSADLDGTEGGRRLAIEGRELRIGQEARLALPAPVAAAGAAAVVAALAGLTVFLSRGKSTRRRINSALSRPFDDLRRRVDDAQASTPGASEFCGQMRDILAEVLRRAGWIGQTPTAGEFAQWLERQDAERRVTLGPALAILEQVERVRFAGWRPTPQENQATRRELELVIDRLEEAAIEDPNKEPFTP